jgi:predicted ATPase
MDECFTLITAEVHLFEGTINQYTGDGVMALFGAPIAQPVYVFKHAMIQDGAYNSLLIWQRRELHRVVGTAIEALYSERLAEHYEDLAHHFTQGGVGQGHGLQRLGW